MYTAKMILGGNVFRLIFCPQNFNGFFFEGR